MRAAIEGFGTAGYFGTSIEGLCASAGVANRAFYEHFDSKEDMLVAVYDDLIADIATRVVTALAEAPDNPEDSARAGLEAFTYSILENDRKAQIVVNGLIGISERCESHRRTALRAFAQIIGDRLQLVTDPALMSRRNLPVLSMALVGATIEVLINWIDEKPIPIDQVLDELVNLYGVSTTST